MNNLQHHREMAGFSQVELAERSAVPQSDISRAEKAGKDLKGMQWLSLAKVLRCSVDELLGRIY